MENNINGRRQETKKDKIHYKIRDLFITIEMMENLVVEIRGKKRVRKTDTGIGVIDVPLPTLEEVINNLPYELKYATQRIEDCIKEIREALIDLKTTKAES